jgi:hypothetical protein
MRLAGKLPATPTMTIQSLPEWIACSQLKSWSDQEVFVRGLLESLTLGQLAELITIVEKGNVIDQHCALAVLRNFAYAKYDGRWSLEKYDRLVAILRKHIVEDYPGDLGRHSFRVLAELNFSWTDEFLSTFPLDRIPQEKRGFFVYDLACLGTESARKQLEQIAQGDWEEANDAKSRCKAALHSPQPSDERHYNPPVQLSGPLLESPEWQRLLKGTGDPRQEAGGWSQFLSDRDVANLITTWELEETDGHRCAGLVLTMLAKNKDRRIEPERERILKRAWSLGGQRFEETGYLPSEYYLIKDFDRDGAVQFVLGQFELDKLTERQADSLFREMRALRGPRIVARLQELATKGGGLAEEAAGCLDDIEPVTPQRLAARAATWREQHNEQDLRWIYNRFLDGTPAGSPITPIIDLLGEPTQAGERWFSWKGKDLRGHLYLETDKYGTLDWMRLYDE